MKTLPGWYNKKEKACLYPGKIFSNSKLEDKK